MEILPEGIRGVDDGILYTSVESYYQAHKTDDMDIRRELSFMNPYKAKRKARKFQLTSNWNEGLDVMYEALSLKFQLPQWKEALRNTEGPIIEWNNWGDSKWGVHISLPITPGTYEGRNVLGRMLMEIRESHWNQCLDLQSKDYILHLIDERGTTISPHHYDEDDELKGFS